MKESIKLEIFSKNKDFDILFNNFRNKYFFDREYRINEIIGELSTTLKKSYVLGCPYNEEIRYITNLRKASHKIEFVSKENGKYYGYVHILDTPNGIIFKMNTDKYEISDILKLYPVYSSVGEILTFDIAWDKNHLTKRILERK